MIQAAPIIAALFGPLIFWLMIYSDGQDALGYVLDEEMISNDVKWDGLYGVVTDLPVSGIEEIKSVLSHYHYLWRIEESFRISKSGLKIRPLYHHKEERIRAHIALIYMAFACVRHLQMRWCFISFSEMY